MRTNWFRSNVQELGGALGDVGTLLPLMVALILFNGLNATLVLMMVGLFYIGAGLYFRLPTPVQPMKSIAVIAIALGLSASVIGAAGLIMGVTLLVLSLTNLITKVVKLFPHAVVRGIQLSIGLILLQKGLSLAFTQQLFFNGASHSFNLGNMVIPTGVLLAILGVLVFFVFRRSQHFPASLALITFGLGTGVIFTSAFGISNLSPTFAGIPMQLPSAADFWIALTVLVIPQLPLTLGNAVVGTWDTARTYFKDKARQMTPRALTTSMGLANVAAGLVGAMPMCHGSGGLTAHYKLGARTGKANLMIGGLLLGLGLFLGGAAVPFLSLIPLSVLGVLLGIVGIYHVFLVRDLKAKRHLAVAGTVAVVTIALGNLALGFGAGILLHQTLSFLRSRYSRKECAL